jgi:uncharacterized protein YciI
MQNIFIAFLHYTKPLAEVDALLSAHKEHLEKLLGKGKLLISGRLNPRTGGVILAKNISRAEFEEFLRADPFSQVSRFEIIEFSPRYYDDCLKGIIN